jgi:hypothetical protein
VRLSHWASSTYSCYVGNDGTGKAPAGEERHRQIERLDDGLYVLSVSCALVRRGIGRFCASAVTTIVVANLVGVLVFVLFAQCHDYSPGTQLSAGLLG